MRKLVVGLAVLFMAQAGCFAQSLADRLPDDAEIYFGWSGTQSPGAAYDQSHLKAIVDASQISDLINNSIPRFINRIGRDDPQTADLIRKEMHLMTPMLTHPTAFYFGGLDTLNNAPVPKLALICDAGDEAAGLADEVTQLIQQQGNGAPITCKAIGSLVVVSDFAFDEKPQHPLSANADFQAALSPLGKEPMAAFYVNSKALLATINQSVQQFAPPDAQQQWPQIRDSLGVDGLATIAVTAGFDGKNWSSQASIAAPAPRQGLLLMLDSLPFDQSLLKLIPQSSTIAAGGYTDLNALLTDIDQLVTKFAPDHGDDFHANLRQLNEALGFDIQKDLLAALGPQWAVYADPMSVGSGLMGMTILNHPRNPQQLETSLNNIEKLVNDTIAKNMGPGNKATLEFRQVPNAGVAMHFFAAPLFSPTWAIKDGTLYVGLFPQVVAAAMSPRPDAGSITDNPDFQTVMKNVGAPEKYASFSFVDIPKTLPLSYQSSLLMSRLLLGMGDILDAQVPPLVFPPLNKLVAESEPAGAVSWSDDAGFHFKSIEPFPGANFIGSGDNLMAATMGQSALATSILLPSLNRARETANRIKCASNLRQIGQGILLYSNDHQGNYPPDLGTLIKTEDLTIQVFVCPSSNNKAPEGLTPDQAADWINTHSDYVYSGAGLTINGNNMANTVVCYEKDEDHQQGLNMLYGDGHVDFEPLRAAHDLIEKSHKAP